MKRRGNVVIQVMTALKKLQKTDKPTIRKIFDFISKSSSQKASKRMIVAALRRCVEFGIMKQKRGHYFLPGFEDSQVLKIKELKTSSEIPLSIKPNVLSFDISKASRSQSECLHGNLQKRREQLRTHKEKKPFFSKPHSLCDLYHNPEFKDSESSIACTIFRETVSCPQTNNL